jgi:hypothetical protein
MLNDNIVTSISGTVTGGAGGTAYLCPSDPAQESFSAEIDGGGGYKFGGTLFEPTTIEPGTYTVYVTDAGNTSSNSAEVTASLGDVLVQDFATLPDGPVSGCP